MKILSTPVKRNKPQNCLNLEGLEVDNSFINNLQIEFNSRNTEEKIIYIEKKDEKIVNNLFNLLKKIIIQLNELISVREITERQKILIDNYIQEIQKLKETNRQLNESYSLIESKYKEVTLRIETIREVNIKNIY